jgi:hypothetical protein
MHLNVTLVIVASPSVFLQLYNRALHTLAAQATPVSGMLSLAEHLPPALVDCVADGPSLLDPQLPVPRPGQHLQPSGLVQPLPTIA